MATIPRGAIRGRVLPRFPVNLIGGSGISIIKTGQNYTIASTPFVDGDKGDISVSGVGTIWSIDPQAVTLDKHLHQVQGVFLARKTAGLGPIEAVPSIDATALLQVFTPTLKGLVPPSGGGTTNFLRADGNWAVAGGGGGASPGGANTNVQFNDLGAFGGESTFIWDKTNDILSITGTTTGRQTIGSIESTFLSTPTKFTVAGDPNSVWHARVAGFGAHASAPVLVFSKTRDADNADEHTVVQNNDVLGELRFTGSGVATGPVNTFLTAARIRVETDGVPDVDFLPGRIVFYCGPSASAELLRLSDDGQSRFSRATIDSGTVNTVLTIRHDGAGGTGTGTGLAFETDTGAANFEIGALLQSVATDVTGASEDFDFLIRLMTAGAAPTEKFRFVSDGSFQISEISGPANPAANQLKIYAVDDAGITKLAIKDSAGTQTILGAGGGGGAQTPWASDIDTADFDLITAGEPLTIKEDDASTNTVRSILNLRRTSTGTPGVGIGGALSFEVETSVGNLETGATISAVTTDVGAATENFDLSFALMQNGAAATEVVRFRDDGFIKAPAITPSFSAGGNFALYSSGLELADSGKVAWGTTFGALNLSLSRIAAGNMRLEGLTTATNAIENLLTLRHSTSGTPAVGIGLGIRFEQQTTVGGNYELGAAIEAAFTDLTGAGEDCDLIFKTMRNGATPVERMRVKDRGTVVIGGASAPSFFFGAKCLLVVSSDLGADFTHFSEGFGNNSFPIISVFAKTRAATPNTHAIVSNNDQVMSWDSYASDGSTYVQLASIFTEIDGTPGSNDMPGRILFKTTPDGTGTPVEALRIDNQKRISYSAGTTLTIAGGVLAAPNGMLVTIDTEAAGATDDLDTIGTTGVTSTTIIVIRAANDARTVVAKDGTGNLRLSADMTLDHSEDTLTLMFNGTNWIELARSNNTA